MNGPEHYAEAERLLGLAMLDENSVEDGYAGELAAAQVHATLALVAAMACTVQVAGDAAPVALHADAGWEAVLGYSSLRRDGGDNR